MSMTDREAWSRAERDEEGGDTIFGLDFEVEQVLIDRCHFWGKSQHFTLLAEGLIDRADYDTKRREILDAL